MNKPKTAKEFGATLKLIRKQRQITQKELSKLTGLSEAALSQFEKNKRCPSLKSIKLLCASLRVSFGELFGEVKIAPISMTHKQILKKFNVVVRVQNETHGND